MRLFGSTTTRTGVPSSRRSRTRGRRARGAPSWNSMTYEKPEQPPPRMPSAKRRVGRAALRRSASRSPRRPCATPRSSAVDRRGFVVVCVGSVVVLASLIFVRCLCRRASRCFLRKSAMALLIASSARTEQWIFTGGRFSSSTISMFLIVSASSMRLALDPLGRERRATRWPSRSRTS